MGDQAIGVRPRAPPELDHVAEAFGCDQSAAGQLAFEQRVGGDRRAMNEDGEVSRIDVGLRERSENALGLVFRRAWNLGVFDRAGCLVIEDEVGERAADIASNDRLRTFEQPSAQAPAVASVLAPSSFSRVTRVSP